MMVLVHSLYQLIQSWTILAFGHTFFLNKCMQTQVSMGTGFQNIVTVFDCFHMHQSWPGPRLAAHMQSHQWRTAFSHHSCDVMKQVVLMSCALNLMLLNMHLVAILDAVGGHIIQISESTPLFIWISKVQLQTHPIFQHFFTIRNVNKSMPHQSKSKPSIQAINPSHQSKPLVELILQFKC